MEILKIFNKKALRVTKTSIRSGYQVMNLFDYVAAPKPVGRRARKPGVDRKPRQAYSSKQLEKLESEFKVNIASSLSYPIEKWYQCIIETLKRTQWILHYAGCLFYVDLWQMESMFF